MAVSGWRLASSYPPGPVCPPIPRPTGTGFNNAGLWIFTRSNVRNQPLIDRARQMAREKGFDTDVLMDVQHEGCKYTPAASRSSLRA